MSARTRGRTVPQIVHPKPTRAEVPWDPAFHYECSLGHRLASDAACCSCPACPGGEPCDGVLRRVGPHGGAVRS